MRIPNKNGRGGEAYERNIISGLQEASLSYFKEVEVQVQDGDNMEETEVCYEGIECSQKIKVETP